LVSVITLFGVVASLKYEMAIVLPKEAGIASQVMCLSFIVLLIFSSVIAICFYLFTMPLLRLLNAESLKSIVLYIPIGIFFYGLMEIVKFALVRKKKFNEFALMKISQVLLTQFSMIGFGWFYADILTLFVCYIFGLIFATILFINKSLMNISFNSFQAIRQIAFRYKKFPLINSTSVFLNTLLNELPVFFIVKYFSLEMVGLYMLANRLVILPMNLIGTSVNKVYFQTASDTYNHNPRKLMDTYIQTVKRLSMIGLLPLIIIIFLAPFFIQLIFGQEWAFTGTIMQILAIGMFLKFITSPISTTFTILNKQEIGLYVTVVSLIFRFGAMYYFRLDISHMFWALTISSVLYYFFYNLLIYRMIILEINNKAK
jgi:O-antigen/teichoic acid export membrane protein